MALLVVTFLTALTMTLVLIRSASAHARMSADMISPARRNSTTDRSRASEASRSSRRWSWEPWSRR
jgi:hypothetical protein